VELQRCVAATFDRGDMKLYVNRESDAEKKSATITHTNHRVYDKDDVYVGALWNNLYNFHASIDEVYIYNRGLFDR
jgi:hypothetical protein